MKYSKFQNIRRRNALDEINEAVGHGKVLTDLQEIFQASLDGRGDLLRFFKILSKRW